MAGRTGAAATAIIVSASSAWTADQAARTVVSVASGRWRFPTMKPNAAIALRSCTAALLYVNIRRSDRSSLTSRM